MNKIQLRYLSYKKIVNWYAGLVKPKPPNPPYNHIIQIGDPTLRQKSIETPIKEIQSKEVAFIVTRMKDVFKKYNCIGLSAPQIGIPLRIIMFEFSEKHAKFYDKNEFKMKEMTLVPLTIVFNPEIRITDYNKITFAESCESVKGFFADVTRYRALELEGQNEMAENVKISAKGWLARIIQHEMDHIDGKIYTDIMDRSTLECSCWNAINERRGKIELPYYANV